MEKSFYSKVLLFGEYSVIKDSMALSIPYPLFEGKLLFQRNKSSYIDPELKAIFRYLSNLEQKYDGEFFLDITSLDFDIGQGLFFDSTIPQGYGVGSSGALCAALFDRYGINPHEYNIAGLKNIFSQIESHFHGKSSGVDPLISYLNSPLLKTENGDLLTVTTPDFSQKGDGGAIFLLNTTRPRRTEPLVNLFLEKCKNKEFDNLMSSVLAPINNRCINSFLEADIASLYEFFRELSDFQRRYFLPMIPNLYQDLWIDGLKSEEFYLKLCGAGGGGFLLGMSKDFTKARSRLKGHEIRPLFFF